MLWDLEFPFPEEGPFLWMDLEWAEFQIGTVCGFVRKRRNGTIPDLAVAFVFDQAPAAAHTRPPESPCGTTEARQGGKRRWFTELRKLGTIRK